MPWEPEPLRSGRLSDDASVRQRAELRLDMSVTALVLDLGGFALSAVPRISRAAIVTTVRAPGAGIRRVARCGRRVPPADTQ
jgi:hypothetical protein